MDEADAAYFQEDAARRMALSLRKHVPHYEGNCLNCGEQTTGAYCDSSCREDAERFDKAAIRRGLK